MSHNLCISQHFRFCVFELGKVLPNEVFVVHVCWWCCCCYFYRCYRIDYLCRITTMHIYISLTAVWKCSTIRLYGEQISIVIPYAIQELVIVDVLNGYMNPSISSIKIHCWWMQCTKLSMLKSLGLEWVNLNTNVRLTTLFRTKCVRKTFVDHENENEQENPQSTRKHTNISW